MSPNRQPPAVGPFALGRGQGFERHEHDEHQLAWTASGVLTMGTGDRTWVLPRSRALWIPAQVPHTVGVAVPAQMYSLYFRTPGCPIAWDAPTVVAVSQLLGELIVHLAAPTVRGAARSRAEALVFDLLEPVDLAPLHTPMPADERAGASRTRSPRIRRTRARWRTGAGSSARANGR